MKASSSHKLTTPADAQPLFIELNTITIKIEQSLKFYTES